MPINDYVGKLLSFKGFLMSRYSGTDLINSREGWLEELDKRIFSLEKAGVELAEKEEIYRVMLSQELLSLTDVRSGVVKNEIAKGKVRIAKARLERDIAKIKYETKQQSIYQAKIELKIIESDIINERMAR